MSNKKKKKKVVFISANQIIEMSLLKHQSVSQDYLYFQRSKFTSLDYHK